MVIGALLGLLTGGATHAESVLERLSRTWTLPGTVVVSVNTNDTTGIVIEAGESRIRWSCNINSADPSLCRGRADGVPTTLKYFGHRPVTFTNRHLIFYRSRGRVVGVQVGYFAATAQEMNDTFARLIENRYQESSNPDSRACAKAAIESAEANHNSPHSSICADIGATQIT